MDTVQGIKKKLLSFAKNVKTSNINNINVLDKEPLNRLKQKKIILVSLLMIYLFRLFVVKLKNTYMRCFLVQTGKVLLNMVLVIPLCVNCHSMMHKSNKLQNVWHIKGQRKFEEVYPNLNFVSIFGKNYK